MSGYQHEASVVIDRSADDVYALVADVSNMAKWSPMCTGATYDEGGEWFTGTNQMNGATWETRCRVVVADPGREFAFVNHGSQGRVEAVRWGFRFRPVSEGATEVTQTWEVLPTYADCVGLAEDAVRRILDTMKQAALTGMPATLDALRSDAEEKL